MEDAQKEAESLVAQARAHADRIREESDRELVAATQRRDSINAQLTNVRQMLATLTSAVPAGLLADQPAPVARTSPRTVQAEDRRTSTDDARGLEADEAGDELAVDEDGTEPEAAVALDDGRGRRTTPRTSELEDEPRG